MHSNHKLKINRRLHSFVKLLHKKTKKFSIYALKINNIGCDNQQEEEEEDNTGLHLLHLFNINKVSNNNITHNHKCVFHQDSLLEHNSLLDNHTFLLDNQQHNTHHFQSNLHNLHLHLHFIGLVNNNFGLVNNNHANNSTNENVKHLEFLELLLMSTTTNKPTSVLRKNFNNIKELTSTTSHLINGHIPTSLLPFLQTLTSREFGTVNSPSLLLTTSQSCRHFSLYIRLGLTMLPRTLQSIQQSSTVEQKFQSHHILSSLILVSTSSLLSNHSTSSLPTIHEPNPITIPISVHWGSYISSKMRLMCC